MVQSQPSGRFHIGALARECDVSVDTVRFYERRGVLAPATRKPSGYRTYNVATVARLKLARRLREVGLTVEEVAQALGPIDQVDECATDLWRLETALQRLDERIIEITATRNRLARMINDCRGGACSSIELARQASPQT